MTLQELRRQLDDIDRQLMQLVARRQATIRGIAQVKQATGFPLRDYRREREVFDLARANATAAGISPDVAESLMRLLVHYSLTQQEKASLHVHGGGGGRRALVIGGAGRMGRWFCEFLITQGFDVEVADPAADAAEFDLLDWRAARLDHDFIVVATPLEVTNEILLGLAQRRPTGIVFDISSLKSPLCTGLAALRAAGCRAVSAHPMFGPETGLLSGRHVLLIDLGDAEALQAVGELFRPTMADLVILKLEEHDHAMAYVLGLTHAVNLAFLAALQGGGEAAARLMQLSSTTFQEQFDLARGLAAESAALYHAVHALNDSDADALARLADAVEQQRRAVAGGDRRQFDELMAAARRYALDRRRAGERRD